MHSTFGFGTLLLAATSLSVFVSVDGKAAPLEKPVGTLREPGFPAQKEVDAGH